MNSMKIVGALIRIITSLAAICVGLGAMGVNVESILHIDTISDLVRYGVGLCGAYSLIMWVRSCCTDCGSCKN